MWRRSVLTHKRKELRPGEGPAEHPGVAFLSGKDGIRKAGDQGRTSAEHVFSHVAPERGGLAQGVAMAGAEECCTTQRRDRHRRRECEQPSPTDRLSARGFGRTGDEPALGEDLAFEDVAKEQRPLARPDFPAWNLADRRSQGESELAVKRLSLSHGAGEVDTAEHGRAWAPGAVLKDDLQRSPERGGELCDRGGKCVDLVGGVLGRRPRRGISRTCERGEPATFDAHANLSHDLVHQVAAEGLVDGMWARPAKHLLLVRIIEVVEGGCEPWDQIALGHQQIRRHAYAQLAADGLDLASDLVCVGLDLLVATGEQHVDAEHENDAVDRRAGAMPPEQCKERSPLGASPGDGLLHEDTPRGVEHHGMVREPPVHVERAARSLVVVVQAGRE